LHRLLGCSPTMSAHAEQQIHPTKGKRRFNGNSGQTRKSQNLVRPPRRERPSRSVNATEGQQPNCQRKRRQKVHGVVEGPGPTENPARRENVLHSRENRFSLISNRIALAFRRQARAPWKYSSEWQLRHPRFFKPGSGSLRFQGPIRADSSADITLRAALDPLVTKGYLWARPVSGSSPHEVPRSFYKPITPQKRLLEAPIVELCDNSELRMKYWSFSLWTCLYRLLRERRRFATWTLIFLSTEAQARGTAPGSSCQHSFCSQSRGR
jgi:hypothetical protein